MRPKERRDSGQNDLFRARLDQIVDIDHPLAKLGRAIAWCFLEERFGAVSIRTRPDTRRCRRG
jgi:transposase, IS5 family